MQLSLRRMFGFNQTREDLIRKEIKATHDLFGQPSSDRYFDFFYYGEVADDIHEWIFHDWHKNGREWEVATTRYLVYPDRVYRAQEGQAYRLTPQEEVVRLWQATNQYYTKIKKRVYS